MEGYVRFSNGASPQASRAKSTHHQQHREDMDSGSGSDPPSPVIAPEGDRSSRGSSWIAATSAFIRRRLTNPPIPPPYESQYLTLIPLSDARLRPRRTKLIVSSLLLLAVTAVVGVFLLVPRGVSVGSIDVHSTKMTFNATTLTYRIILQADVPFFNPNYLKVSVTGNVTVSFFDAEAGWTAVGPVTVAARQEPSVLSVKVDASNLPRKYTQVVYTHCFNFPRKLIFFLLGSFKATYLAHEIELPSIDTYFMLDCSGAKQKHLASNSTAATAVPVAQALRPQLKQQQLLRGEQQQQRQAYRSSIGHWSVEAGGAAAAPDWELEVEGTVPVFGSSSSSSSSSSDDGGDGFSKGGFTGQGLSSRQAWHR